MIAAQRGESDTKSSLSVDRIVDQKTAPTLDEFVALLDRCKAQATADPSGYVNNPHLYEALHRPQRTIFGMPTDAPAAEATSAWIRSCRSKSCAASLWRGNLKTSRPSTR